MGKVEKTDCRANGEVIFLVMRPLFPQCPKISRPIRQWIGLFQEKEMGYAIESSKPRITDRRYPMLPATITNIHQAFKEIKSMAQETLETECRFAGQAMKEVIESRMCNAVDAHLEQMRVAGLPDRRKKRSKGQVLKYK